MDDATVLLLYLAGFLCVVALGTFLFTRQSCEEPPTDGKRDKKSDNDSTTGDREKPKEPRQRRGGMDRMRRGRLLSAIDEGDDDEGDDEEEEAKPVLSKKEQRKQDKKDVKSDAKQDREDAAEKKQTRQSSRDDKYAQRDQEREEMEAQLAVEEAERERIKEEEAQQELEKWKHLFQVDAAGAESEVEMEASQGMLGEFIAFIEQQKVVEMDELAIHFEMRTQDAIKRIEDLLMMKRIHGVIDDRGKFICITEEEMKKVAKFIERRGRVSVTDLAVESNKLIDLTPKRKIAEVEETKIDETQAAPTTEAPES